MDRRHPARRLTFFNHKGGAGKTTLTMNVAATLADKMGYRVLLVDTDPQCNLTSYLVSEDVVDDLLDSSDGPQGRTVWSAVFPVSEGTGHPRVVTPIELEIEGLYLIPGDIRLSEYENDLATYWSECLQRKARGFRGTSAISDVVNEICREYEIDFVFFDSGPNIGPLNRSIVLDCDYFVIPVACDLFSLRALKTLGRTIVDWMAMWSTISEIAPAEAPLLPGRSKFIGYVPQRFRVYAGAVTAVQAQFLSRIDAGIQSQIVTVLKQYDPQLVAQSRQHIVGAVKDYGALVAASQEQGRPIYAVGAGNSEQRDDALQSLSDIAKTIVTRTKMRGTKGNSK